MDEWAFVQSPGTRLLRAPGRPFPAGATVHIQYPAAMLDAHNRPFLDKGGGNSRGSQLRASLLLAPDAS